MKMKREETTLEEWGKLYELATYLKEMEPWKIFGDVDLIKIRFSEEEEPVFCSILGQEGSCYGISCYEGLDGLKDFCMLVEQRRLNFTPEYAMFSQNNLTCYWGNREELSTKQREVIKELGYKYRGKNAWLYFMSYKAGYYPFNFDQQEVKRMIRYFSKLIEAIEYYKNNSIIVDFDNEQIFEFYYDSMMEVWNGVAIELPPVKYDWPMLTVKDEQLIKELKQIKKNKMILEVDLVFSDASVNDNKYNRPSNPMLYVIAERNSRAVIRAQLVANEDDIRMALANDFLGVIFQVGAPKKVIFRNMMTKAILGDVCKYAKISTDINYNLIAIDNFMEGFNRYR